MYKRVEKMGKVDATVYRPYKISSASKKILTELFKKPNMIPDVFGSTYLLRHTDITKFSTILVSYENNDSSINATTGTLNRKTKI